MTMDLWTAQHQQCFYVLLTVHFVDNDFELKSRCLQTLEVPQDLNASSPYGSAGHSILKDWKISEKVCGGIIDNGSNIVNAIGLKAQLPNSSMICSSSKVSHVLTQTK